MEFGVNEFFLIAVACLILFLAYYIIPKKYQWILLLLFSCGFYYKISRQASLFLFISTLVSYLVSIYNGFINEKIDKINDKKQGNKFEFYKKITLVIALFIEIGLLIVFKYREYIVYGLNDIFNVSFNLQSLIVPIGLSFYTFQTLGYCIDVYRDSYKPQKNFFKYMLFSTFFLQILQGPIGRYNLLSVELYKEHKVDYKRIMFGFQRIGWGLFKKLVIADRAAILVNNVLANYYNYFGYEIIIMIVLYAIMMYADFSGYMDMILGFGEVLDIKLSENFNVPYFSKTISEFWRRWHITLNTWFKDYLFYPLLRCKLFGKVYQYSCLIPTVISLLIVWIVTGIWHGINGNYILWGMSFGILLSLSVIFTPIFEKITNKLQIDRQKFSYKLFQVIRTFSTVCIGYLMFMTNSFEEFCKIFKRIANNNIWIFFDGSLFNMGLDGKDLSILIIAIMVLFIVDIFKYKKIDIREKLSEQGIIFRWILYYSLIFSIIIFGIYGPHYNASQFIYMRF